MFYLELVVRDDNGVPTIMFNSSNQGIEQLFMNSVYEQYNMCLRGVTPTFF